MLQSEKVKDRLSEGRQQPIRFFKLGLLIRIQSCANTLPTGRELHLYATFVIRNRMLNYSTPKPDALTFHNKSLSLLYPLVRFWGLVFGLLIQTTEIFDFV